MLQINWKWNYVYGDWEHSSCKMRRGYLDPQYPFENKIAPGYAQSGNGIFWAWLPMYEDGCILPEFSICMKSSAADINTCGTCWTFPNKHWNTRTQVWGWTREEVDIFGVNNYFMWRAPR